MNKDQIAENLKEIATLSELNGDNPFKVSALRKGAQIIEWLDADIQVLAREKRLSEIKGIGKGLSEIIESLALTGHSPQKEELIASIPGELLLMMKIPGLGSKKIRTLHKNLGITTLKELREKCQSGELSALKGFGAKTADNILAGITNLEKYLKRTLFWHAKKIADPLLENLHAHPKVIKAEYSGSYRRKCDTVANLNLVITTTSPEEVNKWLDDQKSDIEILPMFVKLEEFERTLFKFTGTQEHISDLTISAPTEHEIYSQNNLTYIPPELREFNIAEGTKIPELVKLEDIKGAFHNHTTASDGKNSLKEMADAALGLGWEYLGIADHSKSSTQANGLSEERLLKQIQEIITLNETHPLHIFTGTECDILDDGTLDFSDDILKQLDYVVVSVHRRFKMEKEAMTKRIIKALENPYTTMLGHMSGRLLLRREPYEIDAEKIIDCAIANGKIIELNASPHRLDMDWRLWHHATDKGLKTSINPDAHSTDGLKFVEAGVNCARKGWLTKDSVINSYELKKVKKTLDNS